MDICHCAVPVIDKHQGHEFCSKCGLWYYESLWQADPRVKANQLALRQWSQEKEDIVNYIIAHHSDED